MTRTVRIAVLAAGLLAAVPALGQGTAEQREACTPDVMRLCNAEIPDVPRIVACLRRERAQVSQACQQAMRQDGTMEVAANQTPARAAPRRAVR